ncbi:hypothetical protein DICPUDRAFT_50006 [Dictyostelium purpureum]|uniref:Ubiquitin carboxyl-terminal hydrolase n=1 Tax=Dictyostelium purpureum TaxID=5786 RepID=F0ZWE8_DICPU|nr:uncharacterized protein DICPUDRAFT_50006 [Dictyostelium purpureum]EGC31737.1 hypothetical protein DICPUDRAFT_50006 [Dictyostelium purpureum]|eukprot:XP_003291744.1 hypothetical protein DICPUDRAFT_50006 [Dictyostelium purpureum]
MEDKSSISTPTIEQTFEEISTNNDSNVTNTTNETASDNINNEDQQPTSTSANEVSMEEQSLPELNRLDVLEILRDIKQTPLTVGDLWSLVNMEWFSKFQEAIFTREELGQIDNSPFLISKDNPDHLKPGVCENKDFATVPEKVWNKLQKIYGGGPTVTRKVSKSLIGNLIIDLKIPFPLKVMKSSATSEVFDCYAFKSETIKVFKERACKLLNVEPINVRIWDYYNNNKHAELKDQEYVSNSNLIENQLILLDERLPNGKWPQQADRYQTYSTNSRGDGDKRPGITGLGNLGNTCFMNSALQCLSNTYPLTKYFFTNKYEKDINKDNPLGCGGELATEYASLISDIWEGNRTSVYPRNFKSQIERFAPQFAGYHQHDSQELLAFLLDGLHEDLNKVKKKPFFEGKDYDERPDEVIANEQWGMHVARNDSVIVDWFQAQLKSKLVCPDCGKISITFDPFMYLSLPLPSEINKQFTYSYINSSLVVERRQLSLSSNNCQVKDFLHKLGEEVGANPSHLVLSMNGKLMNPDFNLAERVYYMNREIVVYQLDTTQDNGFLVSVKSHTPSNSYFNIHIPLYFVIPSDVQSSADLYKFFLEKFKPLLKEVESIQQIFDSNSKPPQEPQHDSECGSSGDQQDSNMVGTSANDSSVDDNSPSSSNTTTTSTTTSTSTSNGHHHGSSDHYSSNNYNYNSRESNEPEKDPRFIFQMVDCSSYHKERIVFPFKSNEIALVWEDPSLYLEYEKLSPDLTKNGGVRDVSPYNVDLEQCIDLFTTEEQLGPEDPWYCSNCKKHQRAFKKFDIWSAPPILVVHLKRFSYKKHYRDKLDTLVKFPIKDLDLSKYVLSKNQPPPIYDLFAVSNHYGSLGGGHYTAYALNEPETKEAKANGNSNGNGKWYKFDDSHVSEANVENVESEAAYVLFYRRKDTYDEDFDLNKHLDAQENNSNENNNSNNYNGESNTTTTTTTTTTSNDKMDIDNDYNSNSTNTLD